MKKAAFHNLGCKVNAYETEYMQQKFQEKGFEIVPFAQKADVYVINTCTVTNIADRKSRQMLHRAKALNPDAIVVATGCYVQTDTVKAIGDEGIDLIVGNNHKSRIVEIVMRYIEERGSEAAPAKSISEGIMDAVSCTVKTLYGESIEKSEDMREYDEFRLSKTEDHSRVYLKIQDGCNQFCSYCAIPLARGRVRSRKEEDALREIEGLAQNGYKEIVLTGIHLSSYGLDRTEGFKTGAADYNDVAGGGDLTNHELISIIEKTAKTEGISRVRLGSIEPRIITEEFLERLAMIDEFCPHFHLSLQSGCDSVLRRMNRHYTTEGFLRKTELIREYFPNAALTGDVIVGFPGESREEFEITRDFLNRVDFYEVHVFKYSRRKNTAADRMDGQLTEKIKSERSGVLIKDSAKRSMAFKERFIGRKVNVLFEERETIGGCEYWTGYTKEYVRAAIRSDKDLGNTVRSAYPRELTGDGILVI